MDPHIPIRLDSLSKQPMMTEKAPRGRRQLLSQSWRSRALCHILFFGTCYTSPESIGKLL